MFVLSDTLYASIGFPEGCVLSSVLLILYTDECRNSWDNCHVVKYADDIVLLSHLSSLEYDDSHALHEFITWCNGAELQLNISKTIN